MKAKFTARDMIEWIKAFALEQHRLPDLIEVARGMKVHHNTVRSYMYTAKEQNLVYFDKKPGRYSVKELEFKRVIQVHLEGAA